MVWVWGGGVGRRREGVVVDVGCGEGWGVVVGCGWFGCWESCEGGSRGWEVGSEEWVEEESGRGCDEGEFGGGGWDVGGEEGREVGGIVRW